jgi:Fe2+ or Zn2+ uptake regulation protein
MTEHEEKAKNMERVLSAAGFRISFQRRAVIAYLVSTALHPSARQVFNEVKRKYPGLSLATVYNTLGVLSRMRLIKVMRFDVADNRYEPNVSPHVNLICTSCGEIENLEQGVPVRPEAIMEKAGFEVLDNRFECYGLCAECRTSVQGDSFPDDCGA